MDSHVWMMRFTLRWFIAAVLTLSVVVILGANNYRRVQDEQSAIKELERAGATVRHGDTPGWLVACLRRPFQATSVSYTGAPSFPRPDPRARRILKLAERCPGIEALTVWGAVVPEADVLVLRSLGRLQSVDLSRCRLDEPATAALFQLDVKSLRLCDTRLTIQRDVGVKVNRHLTHLHISSVAASGTAVEDTDVLTLALCFPELRSLLLRGSSVTDRGIPYLDRLSELQVLDLGRTGISGEGFASGVALSKLEVLLLPDIADFMEPTGHYGRAIFYDRREIEPRAVVQEVDLDWLESLPSLRMLDLSGRTIRAAVTDRRWDRLEWLALSGCSLDDSGLANIGDASQLRALGIADTAVTDTGLAELANLFPSLRSLDLRGTAISVDGLRSLSALRDLEEVFVSADKLQCSTESLRAAFTDSSVVRVYVNDDELRAIQCDEEIVKGQLSILHDTYPYITNYPVYSD